VKRWDLRLYCTDDWADYQEAIPQGRLYVGKDQTHGLERDHARQRHWLTRFGGNDRIGELTAMLA
jgi:insertion element IS1 protein InsB